MRILEVPARCLLIAIVVFTIEQSKAAYTQDTSAGPPTVHTGDVWVDRFSAGSNAGDKEFRVTAVTADGISYSEWGPEMASDLQWNPTVTRSLTEDQSPPARYEKPLLLFPFPLTPGKTWSSESKFQIPDISQAGRVEVEGKVGDWEQVTVPAGTIRALRVDVTTRAIGRLGLNNTSNLTYWYAPQFNRFVKFHDQDESQGIVDTEMVSYKPAK